MEKNTKFQFSIITLFIIAASLVNTFRPSPVFAQPEATWPNVALDLIVDGLSKPIFITHAGDESDRLFIIEQDGRIQFFNGEILTEFLDIRGRVRSPADNNGGNEEGLLSMAFPPDFGTDKNYFYVYYTNLTGNNQVSRFHLGASPDTADPSSEELILLLEHPTWDNHNGGQLAFGIDGYLYIGTGDGGYANDPEDNAQDPESLLGKLLRIDTEMINPETGSTPSLDSHQLYLPIQFNNVNFTHFHYRIPPDNPFVNTSGYRSEIWALGLRNPWRFSFDRSTNDLYIGDVGQSNIEEIDFQPASSPGGENYGWDIYEASDCTSVSCDPTGMTMPIHEYTHSDGCSITGGYVYRGTAQTSMQGIYFFGDYCSGKIWGLQQELGSWTHGDIITTAFGLASFGENEAGDLFIANRSTGNIMQLGEDQP